MRNTIHSLDVTYSTATKWQVLRIDPHTDLGKEFIKKRDEGNIESLDKTIKNSVKLAALWIINDLEIKMSVQVFSIQYTEFSGQLGLTCTWHVFFRENEWPNIHSTKDREQSQLCLL